MKETVKNSRVCGYLEKIYRELNNDKFEGKLEEPIITIQSTPRAYGHVTCSKIWKVGESEKYELNLGAGTIGRPIEDTVSTILHEMVHIYNLMHNIQDCSNRGVYHNTKFRDKAVSVGLNIQRHDTYGWTITTPSDQLILYIAEKGWTDILINRQEGLWTPDNTNGTDNNSDNQDAPPKKPSSTRKYICPCCGISTRATKSINIMCMDCKKQMVID